MFGNFIFLDMDALNLEDFIFGILIDGMIC